MDRKRLGSILILLLMQSSAGSMLGWSGSDEERGEAVQSFVAGKIRQQVGQLKNCLFPSTTYGKSQNQIDTRPQEVTSMVL